MSERAADRTTDGLEQASKSRANSWRALIGDGPLRSIVFGCLSLLIALAVWQFLSTFVFNPFLIPPPLEVARAAHEMGLKSNCTMLYGHIETEEDRVDHFVKLRELQDKTNGFQTFIPLAFHPDNTALHHIPKTTGFLDLKNIAIARLMLDNIPHIKAYWIMMTPRIAQIALRFGADDIDGTVVEEKIYHDAGATTSQGMHRKELLRLIKEAGRVPMERDTLYRPVERTETAFTVLV